MASGKIFSLLKTFLFVFFALYLFFGIRQIKRQLDNAEQARSVRLKEVKIKEGTSDKNSPGYADVEGGSAASTIDGLPATWWYGPTGKESVSLIFELSEPVFVGEVDIIFLESRYSTDFTIFFEDGGSWITAKDISGNNNLKVEEKIDPSRIISTRKVKVSFAKTPVGDGLVGVAEVKVFKKI